MKKKLLISYFLLIFSFFFVDAQEMNLKGLSKMRLKAIINELEKANDSLLIKNSQFKSINNLLEDSIKKLTKVDSLSLIFMGDIMGHDGQIKSAYNKKTKTYNYEPVFEEVKHLISEPDFAIANLEVTLAGPPFKGYPKFSSPDELAVACKNNGIDVKKFLAKKALPGPNSIIHCIIQKEG